MTVETYVRAQLARVSAEHGAEYGGVNNMLAIALVLRNRVFAGWGGWLEVVERVNHRLANPNRELAETAAVFKSGTGRILLSRVDDIYSRSEVEDITGGALFWVNPSRPIADWFQREVIDRPEDHKRSAHVGPVWFFK